MARNNEILKKTKWFVSIVKEKIWLEEMALEGWFLTDMFMGARYTFEKREPKKVIYEVDRFNLPKNPTLKEIKHKEEFLAMATEMGWQVVVHDEDQNYYLCKEYQEDEINELYSDYESRQQRASKFFHRYNELREVMVSLSFLMTILGIIIAIMNKVSSSTSSGFIIFIFGYLIFCLGFNLLYKNITKNLYNELLMTTEEWKELHNRSSNYKTLRRIIFTNKKFYQFLSKESKNGWHIIKMSNAKYVFYKGEPGNYIYTIDTKSLTNNRIRKMGLKKIKDSKDWGNINNDWQVQSIKDAESKNWSFVCALENQTILYRSQENKMPEDLNDSKYGKGLLYNSFISQFGIFFLIGVVIGLVAGIVSVGL